MQPQDLPTTSPHSAGRVPGTYTGQYSYLYRSISLCLRGIPEIDATKAKCQRYFFLPHPSTQDGTHGSRLVLERSPNIRRLPAGSSGWHVRNPNQLTDTL